VAESGAGERADGDGVERPSRLSTAGRDGVHQGPVLRHRRRRQVRLVAEEQERKAGSAADEVAMVEQTTQDGEGDGQTRRIRRRVDDIDNRVALTQVVRPQAPVTSLQRHNRQPVHTRQSTQFSPPR